MGSKNPVGIEIEVPVLKKDGVTSTEGSMRARPPSCRVGQQQRRVTGLSLSSALPLTDFCYTPCFIPISTKKVLVSSKICDGCHQAHFPREIIVLAPLQSFLSQQFKALIRIYQISLKYSYCFSC